MANTKLATKDNAISLEGATVLVQSVKDGLKLVSQGYLAITPDVAKLYDCKGFKALGYKNFDELCAMEFGMSHGTTVGIRKVFERFGTVSKENKYSIPDKYLEYGYTKLLLFTDKKFEQAGIDPIATFTHDMTVAEMKSALTDALEAKADKQEREAIDTEAKEVDNVSRETSEATETTEATETAENAIDVCDEIIALAKHLDEITSLKPEKACLIEAIIANAKELRKAVK